jgi:hypothetical protein
MAKNARRAVRLEPDPKLKGVFQTLADEFERRATQGARLIGPHG